MRTMMISSRLTGRVIADVTTVADTDLVVANDMNRSVGQIAPSEEVRAVSPPSAEGEGLGEACTEIVSDGPGRDLEALATVLSLARADAKRRYGVLRDFGRRCAVSAPAVAGRALLWAWAAAAEIEPSASSLAALKTVLGRSDALPPEHRLPRRALCLTQIQTVSGRRFLADGGYWVSMVGPLEAWERICLNLWQLASEEVQAGGAAMTRPRDRIDAAIEIAVEVAAHSQEHAHCYLRHALGLVSRFRFQIFGVNEKLLQIGHASACLMPERRSDVLSSLMNWSVRDSVIDISCVALSLARADPLKAIEATFCMEGWGRANDTGSRALILQTVARGLAQRDVGETLALARSRQHASPVFEGLIVEAARRAASPRQIRLLVSRAAGLLPTLSASGQVSDATDLPDDCEQWEDPWEVERRAEALTLLVEAAARMTAGRASFVLDFAQRATEVVYEHNEAALLAAIVRARHASQDVGSRASSATAGRGCKA